MNIKIITLNVKSVVVALTLGMLWLVGYNIATTIPHSLWFCDLLLTYCNSSLDKALTHPINAFYLDGRFYTLGYAAFFDSAVLVYLRFWKACVPSVNTRMPNYIRWQFGIASFLLVLLALIFIFMLFFKLSHPTQWIINGSTILLHLLFVVVFMLKSISYMPSPVVISNVTLKSDVISKIDKNEKDSSKKCG